MPSRDRYFVTGCAGFLGSHAVDRLLASGHHVVGYDNFSTGQPEFLARALESSRFTLVRGDTLRVDELADSMRGCECVLHFAANADVRFGPQQPRRDLEQNLVATSNVLEAMRLNGVGTLAFASTGSVYGDASVIPTPESAPFPIQTSFYGASKLAAEGLIEAYAEAFSIRAFIFRLVSILGERYSHGHVIDFCCQLFAHPERLHVLGDGTQRKSYIYVHDCLDAMMTAMARSTEQLNIYNVGTADCCSVKQSVEWICGRLGLAPAITYEGGERGWVGDSPFILLDCSAIGRLGWTPALSIRESVMRTVDYLVQNRWIFDRRQPTDSGQLP